jgi:hypothetical protein
MFHDAQSVYNDDSLESDATKSETGVLRRIAHRVITAILAPPSETETAASREYRLLKEDAWEKLDRPPRLTSAD